MKFSPCLTVLIETLWNVKCNGVRFPRLFYSRINRNIVECKAFQFSYLSQYRCCINRNIVECKGRSNGLRLRPFISVLIETLWNVKLYKFFLFSVSGICINRNIVECKEI